ncbi:MAG: DegV family protein [Tissierellia bacterium]|nr:DegV family protein [Tissierellia bacterium]
MERIIISDSGLELNQELEKRLNIKIVPFHLDLGDKSFVDENLDIRNFINEMHAYMGAAKSAAPSPQAFYEKMLGADEVFIVTLTSKLSTVYNSASIARDMFLDDFPDKKVHVFDSKSAVAGETLIAIKIQEMIDEGKSFEEIVERVEKFIKEMETLFVLENLDNLIKNGRMSRLVGRIASALSINPVCKADDGVIEVVNKTRGMKAGINRMVDQIIKSMGDASSKTLVISHVLKPERAEEVKKKVLEKASFKDIQIVGAKGLTSVYANEGGIVVAF